MSNVFVSIFYSRMCGRWLSATNSMRRTRTRVCAVENTSPASARRPRLSRSTTVSTRSTHVRAPYWDVMVLDSSLSSVIASHEIDLSFPT